MFLLFITLDSPFITGDTIIESEIRNSIYNSKNTGIVSHVTVFIDPQNIRIMYDINFESINYKDVPMENLNLRKNNTSKLEINTAFDIHQSIKINLNGVIKEAFVESIKSTINNKNEIETFYTVKDRKLQKTYYSVGEENLKAWENLNIGDHSLS